jgi:hypothetical protein
MWHDFGLKLTLVPGDCVLDALIPLDLCLPPKVTELGLIHAVPGQQIAIRSGSWFPAPKIFMQPRLILSSLSMLLEIPRFRPKPRESSPLVVDVAVAHVLNELVFLASWSQT